MPQEDSRSRQIIRVSRNGIIVNVLLVIFKIAVGAAAGSIAVILDAVNNFSDALSSVITIAGTKLAGKAPDKKHPYGHGRIEYIAALLVAVIVLIAGLTSLKESVTRILHPADTDFTVISAIIIAVAVAAKVLLGRYFLAKGKEYHSGSLSASGTDALFDAVVSFATLVSAIISMVFSVNIEGWLGAVIALLILKAGWEIISDTVWDIVGKRSDESLSKQVRAIVTDFPQVHGAFDLILHSYGPENHYGSVHIEVDDSMTAAEIDDLTRQIVPKVYTECGVLLTVGIYAHNTTSGEAAEIRKAIKNAIAGDPEIMQMHGFYFAAQQHLVSFDLVFDFSAKEPGDRIEQIRQTLSEQFPDYRFVINLDRDFSD